jgi:hypothetical protein
VLTPEKTGTGSGRRYSPHAAPASRVALHRPVWGSMVQSVPALRMVFPCAVTQALPSETAAQITFTVCRPYGQVTANLL